MFKPFFFSKKWYVALFAWGGLLLLVLLPYVNVQIAQMSIEWNKGYNNLLQGGTAEAWYFQMLSFWRILVAYLVFDGFQGLLAKSYGMVWRVALVKRYLPEWLRTPASKDVKETPQRLTDNIGNFTGTVTGYVSTFVRMGNALYAFGPRLWGLPGSMLVFVSQIPEVPQWLANLIVWLSTIPGIYLWITISISVCFALLSVLVSLGMSKLYGKNNDNEGAMRGGIERIEYSKPRMTNALRDKLVQLVKDHMPAFAFSENGKDVSVSAEAVQGIEGEDCEQDILRIVFVQYPKFRLDRDDPSVFAEAIRNTVSAPTLEETEGELDKLLFTLQRGYANTYAREILTGAQGSFYGQISAIFVPILFGGAVVVKIITLGDLAAMAMVFSEVNGVFSNIIGGWMGYVNFNTIRRRLKELLQSITAEYPDETETEERDRRASPGRRVSDRS